MSYLASPLWLLLLLTGLGLSAQAQFVRPEYFPNGFALFPTWPVFDPERALRLFGVTMLVLFTPKILGVIAAMFDPDLRKGCGGLSGLLRSFAVESVLSALLSPVMMLIQSRFVLDVFLGRDSGWNAQNRSDDAQPFGDMFSRHFSHMALGIVTAGVAWAISFDAFLWMAPIVLGLVTSAIVSWATSLPDLGRWAWRANIFRIPEEEAVSAERRTPAPVLQAAE
jgi:membrane glycosyltransferase